jgi:hypothetical protein
MGALRHITEGKDMDSDCDLRSRTANGSAEAGSQQGVFTYNSIMPPQYTEGMPRHFSVQRAPINFAAIPDAV